MSLLKGVKVVELCGLAPAPFLGLILSDFGAKVIRIDNLNASNGNMFAKQKDTMYVDLKSEKGVDILERLSQKSDVLIDPFRPGVMERLGLGPENLCTKNPRLIFTRLTGFGQTGPWAKRANHDINFIAMSGILSRFGHSDRPPIGPVNLLGDFAGGSVLCAMAVSMALFERTNSGLGQVIDHSMTEGAAYLGSFLWETLMLNKEIMWPNWPKRAENLLDFGAPFYRCYECSDGKFLAVGSLEPKFYSDLIKTLGLDEDQFNRFDVTQWPEISQEFEKLIRTKTRDEWMLLFEKADACVTPVLDMDEVQKHPQNQARQSHDPDTGYPNPAPKFSRTPAVRQRNGMPGYKGEGSLPETQTKKILKDECEFSDQEIDQMFNDQIVI